MALPIMFALTCRRYIQLQDQQSVFSKLLLILNKSYKKKKRKKKTHVKPWVKISKVMLCSQKFIPPGKGGKPYGKKSFGKNIARINLHTLVPVFKITGKIFKFNFLFSTNSQGIMEISRILPQNPANHMKFAPFIDPLYINAFRFLTIGRELSEILVNRPDSTQFAHSTCKLCKIRTIRTHGQ